MKNGAFLNLSIYIFEEKFIYEQLQLGIAALGPAFHKDLQGCKKALIKLLKTELR